MKRFTIALAVVLALGISSMALAGGHGKKGGGHGGKHQSFNKHHGPSKHQSFNKHHGPKHHGHKHYGHSSPVVRVYRSPAIYYPQAPYYPYPAPVQVYYRPARPYGYGYRSPEASMAIGIGRVVGAAIEMGNR